MPCPHLIACDHLSHPPLYAPLDSLLSSTLEKMKQLGINEIIVTDENFGIVCTLTKGEIAKYFIKNKVKKGTDACKKLRTSDVVDVTKNFIAAYPNTGLKEIRRIMLAIKSEYLPIAKNPWNKVLLGFISLKKIQDIV